MDIVSLKNKINDVLLESASKNKKNSEGKAAFALLNETVFKEIYYAIDNLQNGIVADKEHILENIAIIKKYINHIPHKQYDKLTATKIDESINYLVNYKKKSALTINDYHKHLKNIEKHIQENNERMSSQKDYKLFVENLKNLPKEHYLIVEQLALSNDKKEFFYNLKNDVSSFITEEIKGCDTQDDKFLLYEAREKIAVKEYDENTYVKDIIEMVKVKELIQ